MQSGSGEKGVNRAWNLINRDSGLGLVRCVTKVAAQQRLGLLPDGRSGLVLLIVIVLLLLGRI
jgi:hypothetical protein